MTAADPCRHCGTSAFDCLADIGTHGHHSRCCANHDHYRDAPAADHTPTCSCQPWPPEGPAVDCPVHGAVRALNDTTRQLVAARAERDDARNQIKALHAAIEQWDKSAAAYQAAALDAAAERDQARTDAANLRREIDTMWHNIRVGNPYGLTRDQMANNERFSAEMGRRLDAAELDGGTDVD